MTNQKLNLGALNYMYPHIKNLALAEGFPCHAISVLVRLFPNTDIKILVERFYNGTEFEEVRNGTRESTENS